MFSHFYYIKVYVTLIYVIYTSIPKGIPYLTEILFYFILILSLYFNFILLFYKYMIEDIFVSSFNFIS